MDLNRYREDSLPKRVLLEFPDVTFTADNVREDMGLVETVNDGEDAVFGVAASAELTFALLDLEQVILEGELAGREFRLRRGIRTGRVSRFDDYRAVRAPLVCLQGGRLFAGDERAPFLSVWQDGERNIPDEAPQRPVRSLFAVGEVLYCGHDEAPLLTAYALDGDGLRRLPDPAAPPFLAARVARFNREGRAFCFLGDVQREYTVERRDLLAVDFWEETFEYHDVGLFRAEEPRRVNDNTVLVTAYDRMSRFDVAVDDLLNGLAYPVTLRALLTAVCGRAGVLLAEGRFLHDDFAVKQNALLQQVTGRQVVRWVAEAAASFARINAAGRLTLGWYADREYVLDAGDYTKVELAEYETAPVDKLQISAVTSDVGVIVGNGNNAYVLEGNPLLYADTDAELRPVAQRILDAIKDFCYVPFSAKCRGNPLLRAGDAVTLTTRKGRTIRAVIMSRSLRGLQALTDEYAAVGNRERATQVSRVNQSLRQLRGSVHELTLDITTLRSTITGYAAQTDNALRVLQSSIEQTDSALKTKVSQTQYDKDMKVVSQSYSQISQTVGGITSPGAQQGGKISTLEQTAGGLTLALNNNKLLFDASGLTIVNGGFRIKSTDGESVFAVSASGGIEMLGSVVTKSEGKETRLGAGEISFRVNGALAGSLKGRLDSDGEPALDLLGKVFNLNAFRAGITQAIVTELYVTRGAFIQGTTLNCKSLTCENGISCGALNTYGQISCGSISCPSLTRRTQTVVTGVTYHSYNNTITTQTVNLSYWG